MLRISVLWRILISFECIHRQGSISRHKLVKSKILAYSWLEGET